MAQATASIADLVKCLELLGVSGNEYRTADALQRALDERIRKLKEVNGTLDEGYDRILSDLEHTRDRRPILKTYYEDIKTVLQDANAMCSREKADFLQRAEECITDLENRKYSVLIAGETSAGKSSLINLLLNEKVLPTSVLQNTLTICEISYGPHKEAKIHFDKYKPGEEPIRLKGEDFDLIRKYIEQPAGDGERRCEKIEIKINNALLKNGVVIVDSPGVGDDKDISKIVFQYMPKAFAFIYVINTPNAGGVQEDRLLPILKEWVKLYKGQNEKTPRGITAESALFVCNKWDEIERNADETTDRKKVEEQIVTKLKERIPELDEKTQVIRMSVNCAARVYDKFNVMTDDLNKLMNGVQRLLSLCVERKMEFFYTLMSGNLINMSDKVKVEIKNTKRNREERQKARKEVESELDSLRQKNFISELKEAFSDHVKRISGRVTSYLQSDDVKLAFCKWTERDLPKIKEQESDMMLKEKFKGCIEQRLQSFLQELENKEKLFSTAHDDLEARFKQIFHNLEKDVREIDRVLAGSDSADDFTPCEVPSGKLRPPLNPRMKKFLTVTLVAFMPVLFPIGIAAGVLSAPVFGYLAADKHFREKNFRNNCCEALTELSTKFLREFIENDVTNHVLRELAQEKERIDLIRKCLKEMISKYEEQCKDLTRSQDEAKEIVETHTTLRRNIQDLYEQLMFHAIQQEIQVMYPSCQLERDSLSWEEKESERLGTGSFGAVFKGKYKPPGRGLKQVAIKKVKDVPRPSSVASFLEEAAMLKQLEHKHIVEFYGVVIDVENYRLQSLALVFERCKRNLRNHIFKNEAYQPWKTKKAFASTLQWSEEILDALEFIHGMAMVHRDLKLDNVLIRRDHIKVADLGLATCKNMITGSILGTPLYMAPEVQEGKIYDSKADIYSFGKMMWEMWFGKKASPQLSLTSTDEVSGEIERENRWERGDVPPTEWIVPPTEWIELMTSCWKLDPSKRPSATASKSRIMELKQNHAN